MTSDYRHQAFQPVMKWDFNIQYSHLEIQNTKSKSNIIFRKIYQSLNQIVVLKRL